MGLEMFWYVDCVSVMLQETETELDSLCKVATHVQLNFKVLVDFPIIGRWNEATVLTLHSFS